MKGRRIVTAAVAATLLAGCSAEHGKAAPEGAASASASATVSAALPPSEIRGFALGDSWLNKTEAEITKDAALAKSVGSTALRFDADWNVLDPEGDGTYDWTSLDRQVEGARAAGQFVMATLAYAPEKLRDPNCKDDYTCPPAAPEQGKPDPYGEFAQAVAKHIADKGYAGTVTHFELWNEENNKIAPERYADMLIAASKAIRPVLPNAKIGFGGMAPNAENQDGHLTAADYFKAVNKALLGRGENPKTLYDAVAFHPYGYPALPHEPYIWNGWTQIAGGGLAGVPVLHDAMVAEGMADTEVWLTEGGAPTYGSGNKATQANRHWDDFTGQSYVDRYTQRLIIDEFLHTTINGVHITARFIHTLKDRQPEAPGSGDREDYFGVFDSNGQPKTPNFTFN